MEKAQKISRRILMLLAAAAMLILMMGVTSMAAGVKEVDLVPNESGAYVYTGVLEDSNTTVYHRLVVKKSGMMAVAGASFSSSGTQWGLSVTLCNSKKQVVEPSSSTYVSSDKVATYGVKPGTYYIMVKNQKTYVVSAAVQTMADKGGASKKKATTIKHKKTITGIMPAGEKASKTDWFKLKMSKSKKLQLTIKAEGNGYFDFYLYGPSYKNGIRIDSIKNGSGKYYSVQGFTRKKAKIKKGTYYIKVMRSSYSKKASGAYSIKWAMK